jgi:hypothetical protein
MILTYTYGGINRTFSGRLRLSVIFYYPANGNRSLARIIEVLLYFTLLKNIRVYLVNISLTDKQHRYLYFTRININPFSIKHSTILEAFAATEFNKIFLGREGRKDATVHTLMWLFTREDIIESNVYIPRHFMYV